MSGFIGSGAVTGSTVISGVTHDLVSGTPLPLFKIDMLNTTFPEDLTPDNSFGSRVFFTVECTDGADVQILTGDVNANVAYKSPTFVTSQAKTQTAAFTAGSVTATFSWTTSGTVATLNVTSTTTGLGVVTEFKIKYFLLYATHPGFVYL